VLSCVVVVGGVGCWQFECVHSRFGWLGLLLFYVTKGVEEEKKKKGKGDIIEEEDKN
jgi:hypothetical protein